MNFKGVPSAISVSVSRKKSDGDYGSFEVSASIEASLAPDANLEETFDELDTWLTAAVGTSVNEKAKKIGIKQQDLPETPPEPASDIETDVFDVVSITVEYTPGGEKRAKVKGGRWAKYGVTCWPEVLEKIDFDLDSADAADYPQNGLKAVALMVDNKPKKVIDFQ